jgi:hypothetical protein
VYDISANRNTGVVEARQTWATKTTTTDQDGDDQVDFDYMDDSPLHDDTTAIGILQCLRMLAEEATALGLPRTLTALQAALDTCVAESAEIDQYGEAPDDSPPPGAAIH